MPQKRAAARAVGWLLALGVGCAPSLPDDSTHIAEPRVVAVRLDPPEAMPGEAVTARALVASAVGQVTNAALDWALCDAPKSPAENRIVDPACVTGTGSATADGNPVTLEMPSEACALFGPDTPPGDFRPRDADSTGGYFLPIRARLDGSASIVLERIRCNPRGASFDVANALRAAYVPNRNPGLRGLVATVAGVAVPLDAIQQGADVRLEAGFDPADEESYVAFDPATGKIAVRREALRFSFYATRGAIDPGHSGPAEMAAARSVSAVTWHVGSGAGAAHLFVVLRDSRGGLDFSVTSAVVVKERGK